MSNQGPLKCFKFTYQTRYNDDIDYTKTIYSSATSLAWKKFNSYIQEHNIALQDATQELLEQ